MPVHHALLEKKRPYLLRDDRRRMLLHGAVALLESGGWPALSMSALAGTIGISRQLLYQHFPSLDILAVASSNCILMSVEADLTQHACALSPDEHAIKVLHATCIHLMNSPQKRLDVLWHLFSGGAPELDGLDAVKTRTRDVFLSLWSPLLQKAPLGYSIDEARSFAWMMWMAFFGVRQMVLEQTLTQAEGLKHLMRLFSKVLSLKYCSDVEFE